MAAEFERRVSPVAEWAWSVSAFSLVLLVTAGAGHRYGLIDTVAFLWILGLVGLLALVGLGLAAAGFSRLWRRGEKAGKASLGAMVLALSTLSPFIAGAYLAVRYPPLTDVSTDLIEPPQLRLARQERRPIENPIQPISDEAAQLQLLRYPEVSGRRLDAGMERSLDAVEAVLDARGWRLRRPFPIADGSREAMIEVEAPTYVLRFPVDAVVRLTDEGESTFVDMRMNARYGRHDFGDGARRIRRFMADVDAEFSRQSLEIIDIPALPEEEDPVD